MFYVSSIKNNKIGITDTNDFVEEFYTDSDIVSFIKKDIDIYGTSLYNNKSNSSPIKINQSLSESTLKTLLSEWKKVHNKWTGHKVEDYLASAKIGTKVEVDYSYRGDGDGRVHNGTTVIKRLDYDNWLFEDTNNTFSGKTGDSRFAAWALEVSCIGSKPKQVTVV